MTDAQVKALVQALRKTTTALDEMTGEDWLGDIDYRAVTLAIHEARAALAAMEETSHD